MYTVLSAKNREKALEIYRERGYLIDLVLLDLGMPGMGGYNTLKALKNMDSSVKVIIASGYAADGQVLNALDSGVAGFIAKPYRLQTMQRIIREKLDNED